MARGLHFRVLGSLEVRRGDEVLNLGSPNERKVLGALLVDVNAVVSASRLIEAIWGDEPPESDRNALQTYVARLRRRLRTSGGAEPITTRPPGYAIELDAHDLDALAFCAGVDQARRLLPNDPDEAIALLDDALALWRGPAFAEFAHDEFARAEAARLEELRQTAVELRVDAMLAVGRVAEAISVLEGVVAAQPLRERPHAQLMRALASAGRQVEALRLYQAFRGRLVNELGLEPSPSLREVEREILADAPAAERTTTPPQPAPQGNLAPPITTFVGREDDVANIVDLIGRARVTTLVGVGGVGKTRLALRVAETVAAASGGETWIVELARVNSADAVPHAVATTLGLALKRGADVVDALVTSLTPRRMLLVVDNCEHVLETASLLVEALARRCPGVTIIATSRERLGVDGEHVWPVRPLSTPSVNSSDVGGSPAVALFVDRARAARPDFVLDGSNADAVADICRGLDGLPLALEIAATRVAALSADDLARRLRDRFALLTSGPRNDGARHRTLRALVDWSYGLLDETEQRVFDRLSVFAGGWTLEAAAEVCAPEGVADIAALVLNLAEKSMIVAPSTSGPPRYGMLETLRVYGGDHLGARGEGNAVAAAHARYFLALAEQADVELRGADEGEWVMRVRAEFDNLRAAHEWARSEAGDIDVAMRLSASLYRFAMWQANDEVFGWAESLVGLPAAQEHPLFPVILGCASLRRTHRGEMELATAYAEQALALCEDPDDLRRALPVESLSGVTLLSGRLEESLEHSAECGRLWRLAGDVEGQVWAFCNRAVALAKAGDLATAKTNSDRAHELALPTRNPTLLAVVAYCEGECLLESDAANALERLADALAFARAGHNVFMTGNALLSNTSLRGRHGDPNAALPLFEDVIEYWRQTGGWSQLWLTVRNLVELIARLGAYEDAAVLYGVCDAENRMSPPFGAEADRLAAVVETLVANLGEAEFQDAKARGERLDDADAVAFASAATSRLQHQP